MYDCFKHWVFETVRNISFNFMTPVISLLDIWGIREVCWQTYMTPLLSPKIVNVESVCRTPAGYAFSRILLEGFCLLNFLLRKAFTGIPHFFKEKWKCATSFTKTLKSCQTRDYCPHKENEAQRGQLRRRMPHNYFLANLELEPCSSYFQPHILFAVCWQRAWKVITAERKLIQLQID